MFYVDTPWPDGTPCWVDLSVPDLQRGLDFYGAVLGWTFVDSGEEYGHYTMCQVAGRNAAGISPPMGEAQPSFWTLYLATSDVDATVKLAADAGGTVIMAPMDVPDTGRMAICADPTGGVFGLWQAGRHIGAEVANEPGSLVWEDARLTDVAAGRAFYSTLFPYTFGEVPGLDLADYGTLDLDGRPVGGLGGLFGAAGAPSHWLVYFGVESTDGAVAAATERGAAVVSAPEDSPFGRMATLKDPFGAFFAVHQPL